MTDVTFLDDAYLEFNENQTAPATGVISRSGNTVPQFPATVWNLTPMQRVGPVTVRNLTDVLYIPRSNSDVTGRVAAPRNFEVQFSRVFNPR